MESSISPGQEVRRNTAVNLTVSKGPEPIDVPDTTGSTRAEAEDALQQRGFTVAVTEEFSDDVPKDAVISQSPTNTTLHRGDQVDLVVSLGPETVAMPNVTAMKLDDAKRTLEEAGFTIETKESDSFLDLGFVSRTDPPAGTQVKKGSTVTLWLV